MNPTNGSVYLNRVLDREISPKMSFYIYASDGGDPSLTGSATVTILVDDINDNDPIFTPNNYNFTIQENLPMGSLIGYISAFDRDEGGNSEVEYSLPDVTNKSPVTVTQNGSILTAQVLDREVRKRYKFEVEATDKGSPPRQSRVHVTLEVLDQNDNNPLFIFPNGSNNTVSISYGESQTTKVTTLKAIDADCGPNAQLAFFSNDQNYSDIFAINSRNGDIVLIKQLSSSDIGAYKIDVLVKDNGVPARYNKETLKVVVNPAPKPEAQTFSQYYVIAIVMGIVTVTLAVLILLIIFFIRRREQQALNESNSRQQFIDKIKKEGEEAGFASDVSVISPSGVYYPPGYDFGTRQFHTIERAKSVQVNISLCVVTVILPRPVCTTRPDTTSAPGSSTQ